MCWMNKYSSKSLLFYNTVHMFIIRSMLFYFNCVTLISFTDINTSPFSIPCTFRSYKVDLLPTCLVGCHGDRHWLIWARVILGHSVHRPDFKCVIGMSQEVSDGDFSGLQAILLWGVVDPTATGSALARITSSTFLAHHIVGNVLAAARVLRTAPFQVHWSLIDFWNQV